MAHQRLIGERPARPTVLSELARRRLKEWKAAPCEPPTSEELETLKDYLEPATFKEVARVTATTPPGVDWFDELDARLGVGVAAQTAAALLEADRDGRLILARL